MMFTTTAVVCLAAAGVEAAKAGKRGDGKNWHFGPHSLPGWRGPSVYTPAQPKQTWPYHTQIPPYPYSQPPTTFQSYPTPTTSPNVTASDTAPVTGTGTGTGTAPAGTGPCATVSKLVASFSATNSDPSATPTVPAGVAYQCINSVPFNSSAAVDLMDSIRPYIDWQTTISWLKDPPAEYVANIQPPYDFWAEFERIYDEAGANLYASEYAFGFELYRAFQMAHDGHFVYYPDSVNLIFGFGRTQGLVSVSPDGQSVPQIYLYADVLASSMSNSSFVPSVVSQIDGQDAVEFLLNFSQYGSLQDPDALWNNVFVDLAQVQLGPLGTGLGTFTGGGRGRWIYPGETTELTFANGSSLTLDNFARVMVPFDGITTGEQLYQTYFIPPPGEPEQVEEIATMSISSSSIAVASSTSSSATSTVSAPGYPTPVYREMNNLNSGYFLEGEGFDDVAVLSVNSFVGETDDEIPFQVVNTAFINAAKAAGKTKLIVDVQANGGGTILQGYDLFKQLFPDILPYGATRFRAHEALDLIGEEVSWYSGQVPRSLDQNDTVLNIISSAYNYRTDVDVNYEDFESWPDKFGPQTFGPGPDNFTNIIRWNMSDVLTPLNSGGIEISGYGNRSNITTQPFAAENIVVVTDGYCASTCAIFSELMRQQGGVNFVMLGGRPNTDVVQAVGGVKGTNSYPWTYTLDSVELPFQIAHYHSPDYYSQTALGNYSDLPLYRGVNYVVNARDGYREGDESNTPLQFVYEPADCRIYYTPAMVVDQTAMWKSVADSAFNGVDRCVAGAGSLSGGGNSTKRSVASPHAVRRGLDTKGHYAAFDSIWTGKGDITLGGDSFMPL